MITEQDIAQARQAAEDAATAVAAAEARRPDVGAGEQWGAAKSRQGQATAALERLLREHAEQQKTAETRRRVEKSSETRELVQRMAADLADRQREAVERMALAEAVLADALDGVGAYDAAIREAAETLNGLGLTMPDGADHATGGRPDGVRLDGRWWARPRVPDVLPQITGRVAAARLGDPRYRPPAHHSLAPLFDAVPQLQRVDLPRPRPQIGEVRGAPVYLAHGEKAPEGSTRHVEYEVWRQQQREEAERHGVR